MPIIGRYYRSQHYVLPQTIGAVVQEIIPVQSNLIECIRQQTAVFCDHAIVR
jgi:hypothetical protein